jgi:two-component system, cell cycle sensor histidine kinase and response regulator CckA
MMTTSADEYRALLDDLDAIVWEADPKTLQFLFVSQKAERLLGYPVERWLTEPRFWVDLLHPDDRDSAVKTSATAVSELRDHTFDYRVVSADGRTLWMRDVVHVTADERGRPSRLRGVMLDITDRKLLEAKFRHGQRLETLGRLTGSIAHDFNNLLTAILGSTEQLLESETTLPIRMELREIKKASELAASLTHQLVAFSRLTPPDLERLDANVVLEDLRELLQRLLGQGPTFMMTTAARAAHVLVGKGSIEQVVINLALNARDAMPARGGTIAIRTWNDTLPARVGCAIEKALCQYVVIDVEDTGTGMSDDVAARLFEPFFTTKEAGKGTGLGLSTAYTIVQEAGGWIDVQTALGEGTTLRVYLPVA